METLLALDARLFVLINRAQHPALDWLMPWITQVRHFLIPLAAAWLVLFWRAGRRDRILLVGVLVALGLSDLVSSQILKPLVGRVRPCHVIDTANLFFSCKKSPSFPSSHAANLACVGVVLCRRYRWAIPIAAALALVVGYSRIYVGLHYPLDVLGGYVIGACVGVVCLVALHYATDRFGTDRRNIRKSKR